MKKLAFFAVAIIATMAVVSCGEKSPKAEISTTADSLSYALGVMRTDEVKNMVFKQSDIDSTYIDDFIKGMLEGANAGDDKKQAAYSIGLSYGMYIANQMKDINKNIAAQTGDSLTKINLKNMLAGLVGELKKKNSVMSQKKAQEFLMSFQNRMEAKMAEQQKTKMAEQSKELEKKYAAEKQKNEAWLAENAKKEGVKATASGLQYKVIKEGNGQKPQDGSTVTINYVLKDITGKQIEANKGTSFQIGNGGGTIPGFSEGIKLMTVGSTYEIYVPQELGYGAQDNGPIKPFSTLIFTIELTEVK